MTNSPSIVIAGASGYIGRALIPKLLEKFPRAKIVALSRSQQSSDDTRISWRACDLFCLKLVEETIPKKVDLAFYLVHSMGPTAQLDQGSFADYDLILADNFSRAVKPSGIKQLIYLGGLIPDSQKLSLHLQSRLEVEEVFSQQFALPTTIFRAGLILGESGSSFQILLKLVKRLPIMICPQWTQTLTTPVDLDTVLTTIVSVALQREHIAKTYDLAGCKALTYLEMMRQTAKCIGKKRYFLAVPFFTPMFSRLWVSLITNTSKDLVYPLVESLEHPMVARESHLLSKVLLKRNYSDLLEKLPLRARAKKRVKKKKPNQSFFRFKIQGKTVRSVQRLPLEPGKNAQWIKDQYVEWLPKYFSPLIQFKSTNSNLAFSALNSKLSLLELRLNQERSDADRQLLHIVSGLMVAGDNHGRLEFRVVLNRKFVLAAIHDYRPSLPLFIYKHTQAKIHLFVMKAFCRYLVGKSSLQRFEGAL